MKHLSFTFFAMLALASSGWAQMQSNLVFFSEQGERFFVILNGERQNDEAQTNVKITDLPQPHYKLKIIFENTSIPDLDKNLMFESGTETVFIVKQKRNGKYVARWRSSVPIAQAPPVARNQYVHSYGQPVVAVTAATPPPAPAPAETVTTTTTTVTSQGAPQGDGVQFGISVNDPLSGTSVNLGINAGSTTTSASYTETTTTVTEVHHAPAVPAAPPVPAGPQAMSDLDFERLLGSIRSKDFEDSKLSLASQAAQSNFFTAAQITTLTGLFDFENTRLDFAKRAYNACVDPQNYYMVNDAFDFETSIDELQNYLQLNR